MPPVASPFPALLHARPLSNGEHVQGWHHTLCGNDGDQSMHASWLECGSSPKQLMSLRQAVVHSRPAAVAAPLQGRPAAAGTAYHQLTACLLAFISLHPRQRHLADMLGSVTESFDRRMLYLAASMPPANACAVRIKCIQHQY